MDKSNMTAIIWKEDGAFVSKCPELEVASAGDTHREALENLKEAAELYIENVRLLGILDDYAVALRSSQRPYLKVITKYGPAK